MSTATETKYRKFGVAADPIQLDGAFAEYAKPDFECAARSKRSTDNDFWCEWIYNGHRSNWIVRMNNGEHEFSLTQTETHAIAVAAWNIYCDAVDRHYEIMNQPEL